MRAIGKKIRCQEGLHITADKKTISAAEEEILFSDHVITFAGRSITITSHDVLMAAVSLVIGLLFWTALYFRRKRIVILKRSSGTDQVAFELSRIADALERIANHPADRAIAAATRRQQHVQTVPARESQGISHRMFGL
jgi:hypothetical protein